MEAPLTDWNACPDVERVAGKVSGAWLIEGTRLPVDAILIHADEFTPEEIATEIFDGVTAEVVRRVIAFARQHAHQVLTAFQLGWGALVNGYLLVPAEAAGFDAILTGDKNLAYQQNLAGRRLTIIVHSTNHWPTFF